MKLSLTEAARFELQKLKFPDGMALRLDAELSGCCSWNFTVKLIIDEQRRNDSSIMEGNIPFFIDHFTKKYLGEDLLLDFEASKGFTIKSSEDVFTCDSNGIYQLTT
ncbi:iron-sulfur cluster biosynthesis family protein [Ammoniphilus sp. 3BR4]|uniref:iron-sulfur cluster biosynthesis family protein n=1 Tax=Ammoniphilus sp. 3BR4 TaxID=3158265 RepID=UPI003465E89E